MSGSARVAGHFGEWLQGRLGPDGPIALVTLACPALAVTASWRPAPRLCIRGSGAAALPAERAACLLRALGLPLGEITVEADMPPGGGAGASTAALIALARAAGGAAAPLGELAAACLGAEGATDPLMLERPDRHLWAPREGRSLGALPGPPAFEIVGGFQGPPIRTDPADLHWPDVADLIGPWREAARTGDRATLARIASTSAGRTTALRGPRDDPMSRLAEASGALGHIRAHTGSARGLVFAPGAAPACIEALLREAGFRRILRFGTGGA